MMILKVQMRDVIYSSAWDKEKNIFGAVYVANWGDQNDF